MSKITKTSLLTALLVGVPLLGHAKENGHPEQPNIVFIMADDLGWTDLGCYGNEFIETPAIDQLAASGMLFTAAYTAPVCTPSRGMILSGQYSARTGLYKVPFMPNERPWAKVIPPEPWGESPANAEPLGVLMTQGGYASGIFGKIHVPPPFRAGLTMKSDPAKARAALGPSFYQKVTQFSQANRPKRAGPITKAAIDFIASNKDRPFFCSVNHFTPHIPLWAPEELNKKYEEKRKQQPTNIHPHYAAMVELLDNSVAMILEALDHLGLAENTIVIFFSDNGGVVHCFGDGKGAQLADLTPLRGEKGGILEGGIRVPMIVRWPGKIKPDTVCDTPVVSVDFLPTFTAAAGIDLPEGQITDGVSLLPLFTGAEPFESREIFAYFPDYHHDFPGVAVRQGDFKLILSSEDGHLELYNLAEDIGETKNLAKRMPEKADELHTILMEWMDDVGAKRATPNPKYDPQKAHLLDPEGEETRRGYWPASIPE